jgi:hypothetical protein
MRTFQQDEGQRGGSKRKRDPCGKKKKEACWGKEARFVVERLTNEGSEKDQVAETGGGVAKSPSGRFAVSNSHRVVLRLS